MIRHVVTVVKIMILPFSACVLSKDLTSLDVQIPACVCVNGAVFPAKMHQCSLHQMVN